VKHHLLWLVLCGLVTSASADPYETYGFDARSAADAEASSPTRGDPSASYYNVAALMDAKTFQFTLVGAAQRFQASVVSQDSTKPLDCTYCSPGGSGGLTIGLQFPLAGIFSERAVIGFSAHLPTEPLLTVRAPDPNRPNWFRFDQRERLSIFTGLAIKVADGVSLGLGAQVLANLGGNGANLHLDVFSGQVEFREVVSFLQASAAPTAGLFVTAIPRWRFGLSYRGEMAVTYAIPATIEIESLANLKFLIAGTRFFTPHTFELGATFEATDSLSLSISAQYALWSRQPDPYVRLQVDLSGDTLQALGLGSALDLDSTPNTPGFANTLSVRGGASWTLSESWALRGGLAFRPTPVPLQNTFATNLMDSSNVGVGLGAQLKVRDPAGWFANPLQFDLGGQFVWVLPRAARKDPVDTVPTYRFQGFGGGLALQLSYAF